MRDLAILLVTISLCSGAARANGLEATDIVRTLAPIASQAEHRSTLRRSIDLDIRFRPGSDRLTVTARAMLDRLAWALTDERLAASRFEVVGHTDASGGRAFNQRLSESRAASVVAYLVGHHGIDPDRLNWIGKGEDVLKDPLKPFSAANRRVEIVNLIPALPSTNSAPIPSMGDANDVLLGK